jgi:HEAT repeat protein
MSTQYNTGWVLLTCFAGCAGLASTLAFAEEPSALLQRSHAADGQHISQPNENIQTAYLVKLLASSSQFRVRAQAAISLGLMEKSPAARDALTAALQDAHPAVRAAAATSLGRIGEVSHIVVLQKLGNDSEAPVRSAARTSITKLTNMLDAPALQRAATVTTTAALSATTHAQRL